MCGSAARHPGKRRDFEENRILQRPFVFLLMTLRLTEELTLYQVLFKGFSEAVDKTVPRKSGASIAAKLTL